MISDSDTTQLEPAAAARQLPASPNDVPDNDAACEWMLAGADELFRSIYTRAGVGHSDTLAVCSAIAGEGKTTVAVGLAITLAQDYPERRVLLVETDFSRPVLAEDFGTSVDPGLADCLLQDVPPQLAVRPTLLENLFLIPAGRPAKNAGRLLRSARMAAVLAHLRESYNILILDVPAILVNSDALPLIDLTDGALFVVRAGVTPSPVARKAMAQLDDTRGLLRGVVLNGTQSAIPAWLRSLCGA
jgi:capsular exopolysaccharide synthesis family protein